MFGLLIGMTAIGAAVAMFGYLVLGRARVVPVAELAAEIDSAPRHQRTSVLRTRLAAVGGTLVGSSYSLKIQARLDKAGNPPNLPAQRVLALKGLLPILGLVLGLVVGAKVGGALTVLAPLLVAAFGFVVPDVLVRNLGERRQVAMRRSLPDAIDMMTICVEAGLGFDAALGRVARNLTGPFAEECARMLQEMQIGSSRADALRGLSERSTVAELRTFATAIIQSSELGISIGDVLREQARQMRIKRRQHAEQRAQKMQVKLLFPLIACLMPAMFIVIVGPAALEMMAFFHSGK